MSGVALVRVLEGGGLSVQVAQTSDQTAVVSIRISNVQH